MPELQFDTQDFAGNEALTGFKTTDDLGKGYLDLHSKVTGGSLELLPEDLRKDPTVANYKTLPELAKGLIETKKLVGQKGVIVPGPNATKEEKEKFYNSIGRPDKIDGYKIQQPEKLHPKIKVTPEGTKAFLEFAHSAGLSNEQANALNAWYMGIASQAFEKQDQADVVAAQAADKALRAEWGKDFDRNLSLANKVVTKYGGQDALNAFGDLGNNPAVLKVLANIGLSISEDQVSRVGFSALETNQQQAMTRIKQIEADPAFLNERAPTHDALVKERTELYQIAYGK